MNPDKVIIRLEDVNRTFGNFTAVDGVSFTVNRGEFVTILGPSGCGKTTTIRMIAGFEKPNKGKITLGGEDITKLPPYKRPINTVFQRYALFPHLDVYDNVAFGLRLKKVPYTIEKNGKTIQKFRKLTAEEIDQKVVKSLQVVDLEELEDRDISSLSGGQQQRVAIARCIVNQPEILLLDEPLGALDLKMRKDMQIELKQMHKKLGITFIYVTHDQEEALTMSDTIIVMKDGVIQQIGTPTDIYNEPINAFVADFIGESNIYNGVMENKKVVKFLGASFKCLDDFEKDERVDVVVRPEDVEICESNEGMVNGKIATKIFKGVHYEYSIMIGKNEIIAKSTKDIPEQKEVGLNIEPNAIHIMKKTISCNQYFGYEIDKNNNLILCDEEVEVDVSQLVPGSTIDDEGYVLDKNGKKYDFNGAIVNVEIPLDKLEFSDDTEFGQLTGTIISNIYKGDHYQAVARTEDEEDFILDTPDSYNIGETVGIKINKKDVKLILKGDISDYEI